MKPSAPAPKVKNGPVDIVGLGDSVAAGRGSKSFLDYVADAMAARRHEPSHLSNFAVDGEATDGLNQDLDSSSEQQSISKADVVLIQIGANDFDESQAHDPSCAPVVSSGCYDDAMTQVKSNLGQIVAKVKAVAKPGAQVVLISYWNVFKDGDAGNAISLDYVRQGEALARWVAGQMRGTASAQGALYANGYWPFMTVPNIQDYLQSDGDHPNDAGQRLIANAVLATLDEPEKAAA